MNAMKVRDAIDSAAKKCLAGEVLTRDEMVCLLDIPVGGAEDDYLRETARRAPTSSPAAGATSGARWAWTSCPAP